MLQCSDTQLAANSATFLPKCSNRDTENEQRAKKEARPGRYMISGCWTPDAFPAVVPSVSSSLSTITDGC